MPEPSRSFVILRHVLSDGEHWDLMLDRGPALATWQLIRDPAGLRSPACRESIPARRIGDHRRAYLEYQGPVSGDRGAVTRVAEGQYDLLNEEVGGWTIRLTSADLTGVFRITPGSEGTEGVLQRCD